MILLNDLNFLEHPSQIDLGSTPRASNRHHQAYYMFSSKSFSIFICHCFWVGGRSKIYINLSNLDHTRSAWKTGTAVYIKGFDFWSQYCMTRKASPSHLSKGAARKEHPHIGRINQKHINLTKCVPSSSKGYNSIYTGYNPSHP